MTRRKEEITRSDLQREYPHRVACRPRKCRASRTATSCAALRRLSAAPLTFFLCRDDLRFGCSALPSRRTWKRSAWSGWRHRNPSRCGGSVDALAAGHALIGT
jgi:hypothetical protein